MTDNNNMEPVDSDPEIAAWEKFMVENKLDDTLHPLHYLFLNEKTSLARMTWKAAIKFMRDAGEANPYNEAAMPVVAKLVQRPQFGLRNVIQWTRSDEYLEDGTELVVAGHARTVIADLQEQLKQAKTQPALIDETPAPTVKGFKPPMPADSPFSLPPVTDAPVALHEILQLLREHTNKGYMPSATGTKDYNSKPEYVHRTCMDRANFPAVDPWTRRGQYAIAYYAFSSSDVGLITKPMSDGSQESCLPETMKDIFACIRFEKVDVLVNLRSLATIVRVHNAFEEGKKPERWFDWYSELDIALERVALFDETNLLF